MKNKKIQVDPTHYSKRYDSKDRFISYWNQINEIFASRATTVLEVGVGNKFVSDYLSKNGCNVSTIDIDHRLNPTKVGSILNIPYSDNSFDTVCSFEVLEHLPIENLNKAIKELVRVSKRHIIISIPDISRYIKIEFAFQDFGTFKYFRSLPVFIKPKHKFDGQHYWELGSELIDQNDLIKIFEYYQAGVEKNYRLFDNPYHHFLKFSKRTT